MMRLETKFYFSCIKNSFELFIQMNNILFSSWIDVF